MNRLITVTLLALALIPSFACKKNPKLDLPDFSQLPPGPALEPSSGPPPPEPIPLPPPIDEPAAPAEIAFEEITFPPPPPPEPAPPAAATPESAPLPSLTPLMSPEERQRYVRETDGNLARARRNLSILRQRRLTSRQRNSLNRVREFVRQSESLRGRSPATAAGLASRAAILSQELVTNTR